MPSDIDEEDDAIELTPIAGVTSGAVTYAHEAMGDDDLDKLIEGAD